MILHLGRRPLRPILSACSTILLLLALLTVTFHPTLREKALSLTGKTDYDNALTTSSSDTKLHILLPASHGAVDLCKTLLTGAILGYPTPTLIAWNETFDKGHLMGGGSHVAKISGTFEYLNNLDPSKDDNLVLMMDAHDIWFQLRPEVLISRYHTIKAAANKRLEARLGRAMKKEDLRQTIIFGAGKRCAPNQWHTVACYPIPDSPLPDDLYGANTDTVMGRNEFTSLKQRYLNSGSIIGPIRDVRKMFARAWEKVQETDNHTDWDNGSHGSDFMYHGSDQSVFNTILGEQEFQREVLRRRHLSIYDKARGLAKPRATHIYGTIIKDPLSPDFTHQKVEWKDGNAYEFGMTLDYFSQLSQQTVNTEEDTRYVRYDRNITEQLQDRKGLFDCPSRVNKSLPNDIIHSNAPLADLQDAPESLGWNEAPLFTNVCLDQIPVMVHHNGDKGARGWQWPMTWMQPHARKLLENTWRRHGEEHMMGISTGGAYLPERGFLAWDELCPESYEWELFRDVEKPAEGKGLR